MLIAGFLILAGLAAIVAGLPLAHRWSGLRAVLAASAVLAGTIAFLGGVIILIVPNFFVT